MILDKRMYLKYRGLDYLGRLGVKVKLGDREFFRFIEGIEAAFVPHDPAAVRIFVGSCCKPGEYLSKPEDIKTDPVDMERRKRLLEEYRASLLGFLATQEQRDQEQRLADAKALAEQRANINKGCGGCRKKRALLEEEVLSVEREARRKAGRTVAPVVESSKPLTPKDSA